MVVFGRGEEAVGDRLASVMGRGGTAVLLAAKEEVKEHDEDDILWEARAEAERAVAAKGCRGSGMEGAEVRA